MAHKHKLKALNRELTSFKRAVENSSNTIVITNYNKKIKYVNKAFTNTTGYLPKDVIGKDPNTIKSQVHSNEFYKKLNKVIYSGETWNGELVNLNKEGMLIYEETTIIPIFEDEKIVEFVAIKKDITKQKLAQEQIKKQDKLLAEQSKMAFMGEMLENIAHQWRQPLNVISTGSTGLLVQKEYGFLDDDKEIQTLTNINQSVQYLSDTINDFKDFYQKENSRKEFNTKDIYNKTVKLMGKKFENNSIEVITDIKELTLYGPSSKFIQALINILSNSIDALKNQNSDKKFIFVNIYNEDDYAIFTLKDSGGGVNESIIDRVFEPYFTTKHQAKGTGIGLFMSMKIVKEHMHGTISVKNETYKYKGNSYSGAVFKVILPLDRRKSD